MYDMVGCWVPKLAIIRFYETLKCSAKSDSNKLLDLHLLVEFVTIDSLLYLVSDIFISRHTQVVAYFS